MTSFHIGITGPLDDHTHGTIFTIDVMREPPMKEPVSFMVKTGDVSEALKSLVLNWEKIMYEPTDPERDKVLANNG